MSSVSQAISAGVRPVTAAQTAPGTQKELTHAANNPHVLSRQSSERATTELKTDSRRAPSLSKKVDGSFESRSTKKRPDEAETGERQQGEKKLDVIA